jgi:predicted  nucleic acid-binding Zn-ribbon protein
METQTKKKLSLQMIILVIMALIVVFLLVDKLLQKKKTDSIIVQLTESNTEKQSISEELKGLYQQYEGLKTNNDTINSKLIQEQTKIKDLMEQLKYVQISNEVKIKEYKKEVNTLRQIMRSYIVQIDSLNTKNQLLTAENKDVKTKYQSVLTEKKGLSTERDSLAGTVQKASTLKAINMLAIGINIRGKETNKVSNLDKIKVCFTIDENIIASKGNKIVYLRIAKPDKYVLKESEYDLFEFEGKEIAYTSKREINYKGDQADICIYWKKAEELLPGLYYVDVFTDGKRIGTMAFSLK